ncbi:MULTISPECIES: lipid-A-disaccharide synthase [Methylotenera]|uniref:lipid-A-disaccharide synthase n=1 Tax=Methylotenera TaxID=359407 RepID=UPI0003762601|nr:MULTISPECIES: lipid-A-disaccharide synthase [Methylotenera]
MPKIAIVAGEASGDLLGHHLMRALKAKRSDLTFIGIAGPKMISEGAKSLFPLEKLSVRGYVEVLMHLRGLLKLRKNLLTQLLTEKPAVFIGIDAPDFNFWLERKFKNKGIPAIHYVSPSIWAWRGGRMGKIKRAVSHVLALFPFEPALYEAANVPVTYVGHPLADELPLEPDQKAARETLKIKQDKLVIAMLPGSRQSEVKQHAALFVKTAHLLTQKQTTSQISSAQFSGIQFLVPLITRETRDIFEHAIHQNYVEYPDMDIDLQLLFGHAHDAMEAADIVIVASGTATLEAALLKRPMVITYRMPALSWWILKRMRYQAFVGLPNILAGKFLVPELLQDEATPENLTDATQRLLSDSNYLAEIKQEFTKIHLSLKQNAAEKAANVILSYIK